MIKETITYKDFNGVERTEDFYFDLSEAEIMEMELSVSGGLAAMLERIIATKDMPALIKIFKELIFKGYGEKSPDGKYFRKSEELSKAFSQTGAYSKLFMKLATDADYSAKFVNGMIPQVAEASKE